MKIFINVLLILLALVLQISLFPRLEIFNAFGNIIFLIWTALLFTGRDESIWWVGIGGLMLDIFSPFYFGYYIAMFFLLYFILHYLITHILTEISWIAVLILIFLGSVILDIAPAIYTSSYSLIIPNAIYNTCLGIFIYLIINKYLKPKEEVKLS